MITGPNPVSPFIPTMVDFHNLARLYIINVKGVMNILQYLSEEMINDLDLTQSSKLWLLKPE